MHAVVLLFSQLPYFFPPIFMDRFHRMTASLAASAIALAIPASSLALGVNVDLDSSTSVTTSAASADIDAKVTARCARFSGEEKAECEGGVRAYLEAKTETKDARRTMHDTLKSIRTRVHDARDAGKSAIARVRVFLSGLRMQLSAALNTEAEAAVAVCKDKKGTEHDTCIVDAKAKLQAKVNAAIEAMKK